MPLHQAKTQAPDFARFLKRVKYDERKVENTGFVRAFVREAIGEKRALDHCDGCNEPGTKL